MFNNSYCSFCNREINEYFLKDRKDEHRFCNIICAKLYNDCIDKIDIDYGSYQELIDKQLINKNDSKIYSRFNKLGIDFMPTVYNQNNLDPDDTDRKRQILNEYIKNLFC